MRSSVYVRALVSVCCAVDVVAGRERLESR